MNIYYTTDVRLNRTTAPSGHIDEVCKNLAALGHKVTVYAPASDEYLKPNGYDFVFLPVPNFVHTVLFQVRLLFRLMFDIFKKKPDFIYCRQSHLLFIPAILGKLFRVPVALEVNARFDKDASLNESFVSKIFVYLGVFTLLERINFTLSSRVIVVSSGIKEYIVSKYGINPDTVAVITNGVDTNLFRPIPMTEARDLAALDRTATYVGYIGTLNLWQGLDYFVEAAKIVHEKKPETRFLIMGAGPELDHVASLIHTNGLTDVVDLRQPVAHTQVPAYVSSMDICVCYVTSFKNGAGTPFKVYEYLACAKPVLLADISGYRDVFGDSVIYVQSDSSEILADKMLRLIDDTQARQELGKRGRLFIENGQTWRTVAEKTATFLETQLK